MATTRANITTLNQLIENIQAIADAHRQIHRFAYGNTWEMYASGTTVTPEMWCNVSRVQRGINSTTYDVDIWIVDNMMRGETDELERHSDLILIAEDVIAQLRSSSYGWLVDRTDITDINLLVEYSPKNLCGVNFTISMEIKKETDRCDIPYSSAIFPSEGGGGSTTCDPATVRNSNNTYNQSVASGATLTLPDTTVEVYVNSVLQDTVTIVTLDNETINIQWQ
jgi:hypothetical protein